MSSGNLKVYGKLFPRPYRGLSASPVAFIFSLSHVQTTWGKYTEATKWTCKGSQVQQMRSLPSAGIEFQTVSLVFDLNPIQKTQTLLSAEGCDDLSQMCRDLPVWPAESYSLHLPVLVNYLLFVLLSVPWPCRKPCIIKYLHIIRSSLWLLLSIYSGWLCMGRFAACGCTCMCLRVGERVHFDAQFKVGGHYLFMPLLFLFSLRVKKIPGVPFSADHGELRRSRWRLGWMKHMRTHTHTLRRSSLSIHLPSCLLFVGPSCLKLNHPHWVCSYLL